MRIFVTTQDRIVDLPHEVAQNLIERGQGIPEEEMEEKKAESGDDEEEEEEEGVKAQDRSPENKDLGAAPKNKGRKKKVKGN